MKDIKLLSSTIGLFFMLVGCNSVDISSNNEKNIGEFVSIFNKSINYQCENKRKQLEDSGQFECASFPIAFYMDDVKLGEISSIHKDGYVYPQDIIMLERNAPIYTSSKSKGFLAIE